MFLCLACLLQHRSSLLSAVFSILCPVYCLLFADCLPCASRDHIMRAQLDYQDIAMLFDRMVRAHHVDKVRGQVC